MDRFLKKWDNTEKHNNNNSVEEISSDSENSQIVQPSKNKCLGLQEIKQFGQKQKEKVKIRFIPKAKYNSITDNNNNDENNNSAQKRIKLDSRIHNQTNTNKSLQQGRISDFAVCAERGVDSEMLDGDIEHFQSLIGRYNIQSYNKNLSHNKINTDQTKDTTNSVLCAPSQDFAHNSSGVISELSNDPEPTQSINSAEINNEEELEEPLITEDEPNFESCSSPAEPPVNPYIHQCSHPYTNNLLHYNYAFSHRLRSTIQSHYYSTLLTRIYSSHFTQYYWQFDPFHMSASHPIPNHASYISSLEFDSLGSLLACSSSNGKVRVYDVDVLQAQYIRLKDKNPMDSVLSCRSPVVEFDIPQFKIESLRWNSNNENQLAVSSGKSSEVLLFDLVHAKYDVPIARIKPNPNNTTSVIDFQFSSTNANLLSTILRNGQLCLYDLRVSTSRGVFLSNSNHNTTHFNTTFSISQHPNNQPINLFLVEDVGYIVKQSGLIEYWDFKSNKPNHQATINPNSYLNNNKENHSNPYSPPSYVPALNYSTINRRTGHEFLLQSLNSTVCYVNIMSKSALLLPNSATVYDGNSEEMFKRKKNCTFLCNFNANISNNNQTTILAHANNNQQLLFNQILSHPSPRYPSILNNYSTNHVNSIDTSEFDEIIEFEPENDLIEGEETLPASKQFPRNKELAQFNYAQFGVTSRSNISINSLSCHPFELLLFAGLSNNELVVYGENIKATSNNNNQEEEEAEEAQMQA